MKGSFVIALLMVAGTSAWQYVNVPKSRPNNCGCLSDTFCKVVYINPKTVNKAESRFGRIKVEEKKISLNVVFDDLGSELGAGISGSLIEKDGRPYTVEPCKKNTDNERQFHRLIRQHLMVKLDEKISEKEKEECCQYAENCEKVDLNLDLFDQTSLESVYLETSIDPNNYFDVNTADLFEFKQNQKLGQKTSEKMYSNDEGKLLTLTSNGKDRSALMTVRDGTELFSLKKCGENYFWRPTASSEATYGPGARSKDGEERGRPEQDDESPPSLDSLFLDEDSPVVDIFGDRAVQGPDTCYYNDQYYCQLSQDDYVGGEGIVLDSSNGTDTIGQNWCNTKCNQTAGCEFFTWTKFRSVPMCYLMKNCVKDQKDPCLKDEPQVCMSGPKNCEPLTDNANCTTLQDHGPGYVDWQCRDYLGNTVAAYDLPAIPWGTVCIQSCDSWRAKGSNLSYPIEAHLKSTCTVHGNWTDTEAYDGQGDLLFPTASGSASSMNPSSKYPVPNDPASHSLVCECDSLELKWPTKTDVLNNPTGDFYDPNTEKMTDFLCDYEMDPATMTVVSNNSCTLFCDNYLTAVVRCWDGGWTGKPALGFWCQNEPGQDRGPVTAAGPSTIVITGGFDHNREHIADVQLYPQFCPMNPLPRARMLAVTFQTMSGTLASCGGFYNDKVYDPNDISFNVTASCIVFNKDTEEWEADTTKMGNLTKARIESTAIAMKNGVYVLGGLAYDQSIVPGKTSDFLPNGANTWQVGPVIPGNGSFGSCSVAISESSFLLIGGGSRYAAQHHGEVKEYDISSESWKPSGTWNSLDIPRGHHACAKLGNKVVVSGGLSDNETPLRSTVVIDLTTKAYSPGGDLPNLLFGHGMATVGAGSLQRMLAFGGAQNASFSSQDITAAVMTWDDLTATWTPTLTNLTSPTAFFASVAVRPGMVCGSSS